MNDPSLPFRMETLLREWTPRVLGAVARRFGDFAAAEDAVQEALLAAAIHWPREGLPESPAAWLIKVANRWMVDQIRAASARRRREAEVAREEKQKMVAVENSLHEALGSGEVPREDDTLILFFLCCHSALTQASAIALTLRAVGGLTTAEIAQAFFVPEATMAQRIARAKQTIQESDLPFQLPASAERAKRLRAVLHALYLIFNEGYTSSAGPDLHRADLAQEAIRLARLLHHLQPNDTEAAGLLALMLLTDARRKGRTGSEGELIPLAKQDRALWDRSRIEEGIALLSATMPKRMVGPYQLQAAIAALHDEAKGPDDTDWCQILVLYEMLWGISQSPMVRMNQAVALAMVHGPAAALQLLEPLEADPRLTDRHRFDAVKGHLLELAGDSSGAIDHYRKAAAKTGNLPERNYLLMQAARLAGR